MTTKKRRNTNSQHRSSAVGAGMTAKQMRRKRPINNGMLVDIEPITDNQKILFDEYAKGKNIFGYGCAGTGKTFISLYLALKDVLDETTPYDKVYIVRSLVSTRAVSYTHLTLPTIYSV